MLPNISSLNFYSRVHKIIHLWNDKYHDDLDTIILSNGKATQKNQKTVSIVGWLLSSYNLADTIFFFTPRKIIIYASQRKIKFFKEIKQHQNSSKYNLQFVQKVDNIDGVFNQIWQKLHSGVDKPKIGEFLDDQKSGSVCESFTSYLKKCSYDKIQISQFFNECLVTKDQQELVNIKKSSLISSYFFTKFIQQVEDVIDQGSNKKQTEICQKIVNMMGQQSQLKKCQLKISNSNSQLAIDKQFIDYGAPINLQSGGIYAQKLFSQTLNNFLKHDCIVLGLGCAYKSYNSYVARTLLINPTKQQKSMYKKSLNVLNIIIENLKPGTALNEVYAKAANFIKQQMLEVSIPKSFGFGTGIFLKEDITQITQDNDKKICQGYAFLINCTFSDLKNTNSSKSYKIQIIQTVILPHSKNQQVTTQNIAKSVNQICYELGEDQQNNKRKSSVIIPNPNEGRPLTRRGSKNHTLDKMDNFKKRTDHQKILKKKKFQQIKKRDNQNFNEDFRKQKFIQHTNIQSYKRNQDIPKNIQKNQICIDEKNYTILLPINNKHVPFHVYLLKNLTRSDEGKMSSLRFNFVTISTLSGTNLILPQIQSPTTFIKQIFYRSNDQNKFIKLQKDIKALQKKIKTELTKKSLSQDVFKQQSIKLNKNKKPMMRQLMMRPLFDGKKKKLKGNLQCHFNGFRYTASKEQNLDVLFSNIKHAIYQPCQKQIIAVLHFRLHQPIMIGQKKSIDVQFYSEPGQFIQEIDNNKKNKNRTRYQDDDSDDQQRQREKRRKLDRQFQFWIENCRQYSKNLFKFEKPQRGQGFYGSFGKHNSFFQPTKSCLINVTQSPFFICTLDEIQVVCLERIFQNNRTFDLVMVMKDYKTYLSVCSIPMNDVEKIRDWIDGNNIIYYDQGKSLNWNKFLAGIRKDFKQFVKEKAWMAWDQADQIQVEQQQEDDDSFSSQDDQSESSSEDDFDEEQSSFEGQQELSQQGISLQQLGQGQDRERQNTFSSKEPKKWNNRRRFQNKK